MSISGRASQGTHQTLTIPKPLRAWETRTTASEVIAEIDRLLNHHSRKEIALLLNEQGLRSGTGIAFTDKIVKRLCRDYQLKSRYDRLRDTGKLTLEEIADQLHVSKNTVKIWRRNGLLRGHPYNHKNECLFDPPDQGAPVKQQGRKLSERCRFPEVLSNRANEVQHGT